MQDKETYSDVKDYYGKVLDTNEDLKTSACCIADEIPQRIKNILKEVHPEVMSKFYGCGSPIPSALEGATVLDLGSGSGRDCYVLSKLVGESGHVIGVDMTDEQLSVAREHVDYHTEKFGFKKPNVEFRKAYIEDLSTADIADNSIDLVTSNCVLNLSPNKDKVFREIFRVLKPGGELYFSDVFADRRIPQVLQDDPVLRGECLSGALYVEDFRRFLLEMGCSDYRVVSSTPLTIEDESIDRKIGMVGFYSMTIRAFKLNLEDRCEDFGQVAYYKGTLPEAPHNFWLDDHHNFKTGQPMPVCSNTASMISDTRYADHFTVTGDTSTHYGLFDCGPQGGTAISTTKPAEPAPVGGCC